MKYSSKKYHLRLKSYSKKCDKAYVEMLAKDLKLSYKFNNLKNKDLSK